MRNLFMYKKAFTLVETLVAIAVLLLAVVAPLTIVSDGVSTANLAKDQVTASYLAQEGVELVRLYRDTNILKGNAWLGNPMGSSNTDFPLCVSRQYASETVKYCQIVPRNPLDTTSQKVFTCADAASCPFINLYDSPNAGAELGVRTYGYIPSSGVSNWSQTLFKRAISVVEIAANKEAEVISIVTWTTNNIPRTVTVKERLLKWN